MTVGLGCGHRFRNELTVVALVDARLSVSIDLSLVVVVDVTDIIPGPSTILSSVGLCV